MRLAVLAVAASLLGTHTGRALAAGECPDGDWFCDPPAAQAPPPERERESRGAASEQSELMPPYRESRDEGDRRDQREIRIDVERVRPAVPRRRARRFREWGINLHAVVGLMGDDANAAADAGMNGLGAALRFRPIPHIAIEGSLELLWGTDYNGLSRFENAVLVNGLFFANPRSAIQLYGIAGFGVAGAYLDDQSSAKDIVLRDDTYSYVGAQLGFGLEARVTRHFALGADLIGFLRTRNDRYADRRPEFVDPATHRTTNTSGGGLLRLGATYYW